jgi:ATP-binding cassette subfamily C protein CydD
VLWLSTAGAGRRAPVDVRLMQEHAVRRSLVASITLGLVSAASIVVQALALASLLSGAMASRSPDPMPALVWLAGAIVARGITALLTETIAAHGAEAAKAALRSRLVAAAVRQVPGRAGVSPSEIATVAGRGLDGLDSYIGRYLPDLVLAAAIPVALVTVIGALDWVSAIVVVVVIGLFPVFGYLVGHASTDLAGQRWKQVEAFGRQIADVFEGLPTLKAFGRSANQRLRIAQAGELLNIASLSTLRVAFLSALVLDTLASVSVAMVAVPLGLRLLNGSVPLPAALAVLIIAPEVFLPLRRASSEFHESTEGLAAAGRALDVIAAGGFDRVLDSPRSMPRDPGQVEVGLRGVSVERPGRDRPLLDDTSLTIHPGEKVVLIGPNGSGKSTTLALLMGFIAPDRGSVTVDGIDLRRLDARAWRALLGFLPEQPVLISGSLGANLRLADPRATDAQLREMLELAGAADLVAGLPDGLETRLGERGRPISAGELQRIALARVLLRPASLYLMDEPTVHLDDAAEALVVDALQQRLAGRSALIVTHRPAVARLADLVIALDGGRFVTVPAAAAVPA